MMNFYNIIKIDLAENIKEEIRGFLTKSDVNYKTIFPDLKGFFNGFFNESKYINMLDGNLFNNHDRYDDAIKEYKKVIKMDEEYIYAYINWGTILLKQGINLKNKILIEKNYKKIEEAIVKFEEAIVKFEEANKINSKNSHTLNN